jgi:hypothetical protein
MDGIRFGYKQGAEKGVLEIDSEAVVIVQMVFQLVKNAPKRISCAKIARMMNEQHIITLSVYRQQKGNRQAVQGVGKKACSIINCSGVLGFCNISVLESCTALYLPMLPLFNL